MKLIDKLKLKKRKINIEEKKKMKKINSKIISSALNKNKKQHLKQKN